MLSYESDITIVGHENAYYQTTNFHQRLASLLEQTNLRCGISQPFFNIIDLHAAQKQANAALITASKHSSPDRIFRYQDHFSSYFIHLISTYVDPPDFCDLRLLQWASEDFDKRREYVKSLMYCLINGNNMSMAAEKLFIHRNTLMYRIQRIENDLKISLSELSDSEKLCLYLTCLIVLDA